MARRSCIINLVVAEELNTCMTSQSEPVDVVFLDYSKAFDSVCHRLLVKKMAPMGNAPQDEFLKNSTFFEWNLEATSLAKVL